MLSPKEKAECQKILALLEDCDIFNLAGTLTGRTVKVLDRKEAEDVILTFAESADGLLNRRKISKDILLKYCLSASVPVSLQYSKFEFVNAIIKHWALTSTSQYSTQPPALPLQHQNHNQSALGYDQMTAKLPNVTFVNNCFNIVPSEVHNQTWDLSSTPQVVSSDQKDAESFVKWFYEMLNSCHPEVNQSAEVFGPQHFWENAHLFLHMLTSIEKQQETIVGGDKVAERLLSFAKYSNILFNPNITSQGVALRSTSHGSKVILVCGTVHNMRDCLGIFQQSFALVSDPLQFGKWKVKVTCLKMEQCTGSRTPEFKDCVEIQAIEEHTMSVLQQFAVTGS